MSERILVVAEDPVAAGRLHQMFAASGYVVTGVVSTGAEALLEAERNRPEMVLLDSRIPGALDANETARILRESFRILVAGPLGTANAEMSAIRAALEDAAGQARQLAPPGAGPLSMARAERELIVRALRECNNNQTRAARELGITRDVLRHRMKKYGLLESKRGSAAPGEHPA